MPAAGSTLALIIQPGPSGWNLSVRLDAKGSWIGPVRLPRTWHPHGLITYSRIARSLD